MLFFARIKVNTKEGNIMKSFEEFVNEDATSFVDKNNEFKSNYEDLLSSSRNSLDSMVKQAEDLKHAASHIAPTAQENILTKFLDQLRSAKDLLKDLDK